MKAVINAKKLTVGGMVACLISFLILVLGLGAIGGGHGEPTLWIFGIFALVVSGLILLTGMALLLRENKSKKIQIGIAMSIIAIILIYLNFFALADWVLTIVYWIKV